MKEWIKLGVDIFDDPEIKILLSLPNGNSMFTAWLNMCCMAAKKEPVDIIFLRNINKNLNSAVYHLSVCSNISFDLANTCICGLCEQEIITVNKDYIKINKKPFKPSSRNRMSPEYISWRSSVFDRDNFTCQKCGLTGVKVQAHHINGWASFPSLRFKIDNGITLCLDCHRQAHVDNGGYRYYTGVSK